MCIEGVLWPILLTKIDVKMQKHVERKLHSRLADEKQTVTCPVNK